MQTALYFCEQVLRELNSQFRNRDEKIDIREVRSRLDQVVNAMAKQGILNSTMQAINDQFVLTSEWITVTDPANSGPSYFSLPVTSYIELPNNRGIDQVYFENAFSGSQSSKKKYFDPVIIRDWKSFSSYRKNLAINMEGRISCAPKNGQIVFDRGNIAATYGRVGIRTVGRDASVIADDAPYVIPADLQNEILTLLVAWFRDRRSQPADLIRDDVDKT